MAQLNLSTGYPLVAGILNVTPDSFSDGGDFFEPSAAVAAADKLIGDGADFVDVGGESTRPGSTPIDADTEWNRIEPAVRICSGKYILSIDTQKSSVAERALDCGAQIINDVSALRTDPRLAQVVSRHNAYLVLMFSAYDQIRPPPMAAELEYSDVVKTIAQFLIRQVQTALDAGIRPEKIVIDPGMGAFVSSNPAYSWEIISGLPRLKELGAAFPIMIGASRKGFLGGSLAARDPISQLAALAAVRNGAKLVRTHNVKMARDLLDQYYPRPIRPD